MNTSKVTTIPVNGSLVSSSIMKSSDISSSSNVPLSTLQAWLSSLLDEVPDWEITPDTLAILSALYHKNISIEADSETECLVLEQKKIEYDAESQRLREMLQGVGQGVEDSLNQGPAQAYCDVLTTICSILDIDSSNLQGLENALTTLLQNHAEQALENGILESEVEQSKNDTLAKFEQLKKLEDILELVTKNENVEALVSSDRKKKLDYIVAKCADYKRVADRSESVLHRNGGNDMTLRHDEIKKKSEHLKALQNEYEPMEALVAGFLSLPPSIELAKVEIEKKKEELASLERQISEEIGGIS